MSRNPEADEVWRAMTALVTDNRDSWRRATVDQTGLPFSRIRILLRLSRGSMTVTEVAHAVTIDPPGGHGVRQRSGGPRPSHASDYSHQPAVQSGLTDRRRLVDGGHHQCGRRPGSRSACGT